MLHEFSSAPFGSAQSADQTPRPPRADESYDGVAASSTSVVEEG